MIEASTLGYLAAFCTTCSFIPQVVHTLRTKDTSAISLGMYSFFVIGVTLWFFYGLLMDDLPIIIANGITILLSSVILLMKIKDCSRSIKQRN